MFMGVHTLTSAWLARLPRILRQYVDRALRKATDFGVRCRSLAGTKSMAHHHARGLAPLVRLACSKSSGRGVWREADYSVAATDRFRRVAVAAVALIDR